MKENKALNIIKGAGIFILALIAVLFFNHARTRLLSATYGNFLEGSEIGVEYDFNLNGTFTLNVFRGGEITRQTGGKYIISPAKNEITISYDEPVKGLALPEGTVHFERGFDYIRIGDEGFTINPGIARRQRQGTVDRLYAG